MHIKAVYLRIHQPKKSTHSLKKFYIPDAFTTMTSEMQKNYPTFKKSVTPTHIVFKETRYLHVIENILTQCSDVKIVGIVRNPLAVLASWLSAPREFKPEWDIHNEWRKAQSKNQNRPEEYYGFDKWEEIADAFLLFKSQFPKQFLLVSYDELNRAPLETTKKLFDFCGLDICDEVQKFLIDSKSRHDPDPYSVYRANASDKLWQNTLPNKIAKQIMLKLQNTPLDIFLQDGKNA
jgi:hypothetical protein